MSLTKRQFLKQASVLGAAIAPLRHAALAKDDEPLGVAVIGHTGRGDFGHGLDTLWKAIPSTRIIALADPDERGRSKAGERLDLHPTQLFSDYREMLTEKSPDLVAVAPRHVDQHFSMAAAAAKAGARGIYIEKPFLRDLAEADELISILEQSGTRLAIAHRNRYHPVLPVLRNLIKEGEIGDLLEIRCRGKEDSRGGCLDLWVLGSHLLNLAHFFSGDAIACSATILAEGRAVTAADLVEGSEGVGLIAGNAVHARFDTKSGVPVFFDSIQNRGNREAGFGLQLIGTEGVIDLRADREPLAHIRTGSPFLPAPDPRPWRPVTSGGVSEPEPVEDIRALVGGHRAAIEDLLAAIKEGRDPLCSGHDGRAVLEMTLGVFESHRQGGARIGLPLARRTHPFADWNSPA